MGKATGVTTTRGNEEKNIYETNFYDGSCFMYNVLIAPHTAVTWVPNKKVSDFRGHCCATRI